MGVFVPHQLKPRGASGGTRTPSAGLYVRLPAALDIDLRSFCAAHEFPLASVVRWALADFLRAALPCTCPWHQHQVAEDDRG
jgi:hypothetical protein